MPVMVTEALNFEEQLINMKAMLDRLSKETTKNDIQIKYQNE